MKKARNITLIIGLICNFIFVLRSLFMYFFNLITNISEPASFNYFFVSDMLPAIIVIALMIIPVVLLVCNLKYKAVRSLSIISIVIYGIFFVSGLVANVTAGIPSHLIMSKLGLINTYWSSILSFFASGGLLLELGFLLIIIGSVLSLPKKR